jgi:hypothetical protein
MLMVLIQLKYGPFFIQLFQEVHQTLKKHQKKEFNEIVNRSLTANQYCNYFCNCHNVDPSGIRVTNTNLIPR